MFGPASNVNPRAGLESRDYPASSLLCRAFNGRSEGGAAPADEERLQQRHRAELHLLEAAEQPQRLPECPNWLNWDIYDVASSHLAAG